MVYFSLPKAALRDREVIHFVDNTSALAGLLKGGSPKRDSARMLAMLHLHLTAMRTSLWWEYVPSKANIADGPSRGDFSTVAYFEAKWMDTFTITREWYTQPLTNFLGNIPRLSGAARRKRKATS